MSDPLNKRFHVKLHVRILAFLAPLMLLLTLSLLCMSAFAVFVAILGAKKDLIVLILFESVIVFSILVIAAATALNIIFSTIPMIKAHLDVTEAGLEYDWAPVHHVRCRWEDIAAIEQRRGFLSYDRILLNTADVIGPSRTVQTRKFFHLDPRPFITLNGLEGWPDGELKAILKQRVPQLFQ